MHAAVQQRPASPADGSLRRHQGRTLPGAGPAPRGARPQEGSADHWAAATPARRASGRHIAADVDLPGSSSSASGSGGCPQLAWLSGRERASQLRVRAWRQHRASDGRACNSRAGPPARAGSAHHCGRCTTRTRGLARQGRQAGVAGAVARRLPGCGRPGRERPAWALGASGPQIQRRGGQGRLQTVNQLAHRRAPAQAGAAGESDAQPLKAA